MITQVMDYCKNHFIYDSEYKDFAVVVDGITGDFDNTYLTGMYIMISGSYLNDGVYKIASATSSKLTTEDTLIAEDTDDHIIVYSLRIPPTFVTLVAEITTYDTTSTKGVKSESQGQRSVTYGSSSESDGSDWQSVYLSSLSTYKRIIDDRHSFSRYNQTSKRWY